VTELEAALAGVTQGWSHGLTESGGVRWLPLVRTSGTGLWLGLSPVGEWVVGRLDGDVVVGSSVTQPWLTILDADVSEFGAALSAAARLNGLDLQPLQASLPIHDVLVMAIRSGSGHWAKRAVVWMQGRVLSDEERALAAELATARWVDQWTRHNARRIAETQASDGS
jgi:hypothetical protein